MRKQHLDRSAVKQSRFPVSLFGIFLLTLLLMSGIHTGLIVGMNKWEMNVMVQTGTPMLYWGAVAAALTWFTAWKIRKTYEVPMRTLAKATSQVSQGDFSVYIPPIHTPEKLDYLDVMIMDFNKMVEELGSIETLKTDFFSNVSHEIKTPLAVIQNNAELLQRKSLTEEQKKECTENILFATKRLSSLITNMLKLNKLEKQAIKPVPQKYDLCAQLCQCTLQLESVWDAKGIDLEADLEEQAVIEGDEELLALVWTNLLSNAIKFTPSGGQITISQKSDDKKVTVSVADTGCGMDEETKKHVFEKFYQGDTSHATEGNGLGLALVKRILQLSEGSISVESTEGKSTVFTVELPVSLEKGDGA